MKTSMTLVAVCLVISCASYASAALLCDDTNAMSSYQGTATYSATDGTSTISATVDYAVYAPGDYSGTDPSNEDHYVYAYEIFNTTDSGIGDTVYDFSVGITSIAGVVNAGTDTSSAAPGDSDGPEFAPVGTPTQTNEDVSWSFIDTAGINYGTNHDSVTLIFTSPNAPQWRSATIKGGGGVSNFQDVPSPVPDPATISLLSLGSFALMVLRRRRRKV